MSKPVIHVPFDLDELDLLFCAVQYMWNPDDEEFAGENAKLLELRGRIEEAHKELAKNSGELN